MKLLAMPEFSVRDVDRFMGRVLWPSSISACWLWRGYQDADGYGRVVFGQTHYRAHRVAYHMFRGSLPQDLVIDHLCRVRNCVNPLHMEPVTIEVNSLRGFGVGLNRFKTKCPQGHEYSPSNTAWYRGGRFCRACNRAAARAYKARKSGRAL